VSVLPASFAPLILALPLAWVLCMAAAAGAMVLATLREPRHPPCDHDDDRDVRRHLARSGRRGERAEVVAIRCSTAPSRLAAALRISDSVCARVTADGSVHALVVVDAQDFDRDAFARRLGAELRCYAVFGFARFPEDGGTLDVLGAHARASVLATMRLTDASHPG
jgi:hypothetical protein